MPRDGTGNYTRPFPDVIAGTQIESAVYNGFTNDVANDLNVARPIIAGGTGATNAAAALIALGGENAKQVITNYNSDTFVPGSFHSAAGATGAPVAGHAFSGICYASDTANLFIEAVDQDEASQPGHKWVRQLKASVWSAWATRDYDVTAFTKMYVSDTVPAGAVAGSLWWESDSGLLFVLYNDGDTTQWVLAMPMPDLSQFVAKTGDTLSGGITLAYDNPRQILNDTSGAIPDASWAIQLGGAARWSFGTQVGDATGNFSLYNTPAAKQAYSFDATTALGTIAGDPTAALGIATKQYVDRNATTKNFIVNGGMQISQEQGPASGGLHNFYPVDQFYGTNTSTANITVQQVTAFTPSGSPNRVRITVGTAGAATGSQLASFKQRIEGNRIAELMFGGSTAKTFTLQFGFKGPAGTYGLSFYNGAFTRIWASAFTVAAGEANTDVVKSVTIPGDLAGTWALDANIGLQVEWVFAAGTGIQMAPTTGPWSTVSGGVYIANTITNNIGALNTFEIFDVGLYKGSSAPPFTLQSYGDAMQECKRYFHTIVGSGGHMIGVGSVWSSAVAMVSVPIPVMRSAPTLALSTGVSAYVVYTNATSFAATSISIVASNGTSGSVRLDVAAAGITAGQACALLIPGGGAAINLNARM